MKRSLSWMIKIGVSLGILIYLFRAIPIQEVAAALGLAKWEYVGLALAIGLVARYLAAYRMKILAEAQGIALSLWEIQGINFSTSFYGLFLPGYLAGGAIRWYKFSQGGNNASGALAAIVVNRLAQTTGIAVFGLAAWLLDGSARQQLIVGGLFAGTVLVSVAAGILVFGRSGSAVLGHVVEWIPGARLRRPVEKIQEAARQFGGLSAQALGRVWAATFVGEVLGLAGFYFFAQAVGIALPIVVIGWIRSLILLATMLPISISGLGVREGALIYFLAPYGIEPARALAFSVLLIARHLSVGAIGGLIEARQWFRRSVSNPGHYGLEPAICLWGTSLKKVADEAQLLSVSEAIRREWPSARITIFARNGQLIARSAAAATPFSLGRDRLRGAYDGAHAPARVFGVRCGLA